MSDPMLLFSDMFTEDSRVADWLDTHCEYDHTDRCWYGTHFFDEGVFETVHFNVIQTTDDFFCINVESHRGVDPLVTESVGELLMFLDNTDWHSIAISNLEDWLDDRFQVISTNDNGSIIWRAIFHTDFAVQQNFTRKFDVELTAGRSEFIIHHGIARLNPLVVTSIREMLHQLEKGRLYCVYMDEFFQASPAHHELNELRWWLDENFTLEEDQLVWHGTHPQAPRDIDFRLEEIPGGFLVECDSHTIPLDPFTATSIDALQEFMVNTDWNHLFYIQQTERWDEEERAYECRLRSAGPAHPDYARYFDRSK